MSLSRDFLGYKITLDGQTGDILVQCRAFYVLEPIKKTNSLGKVETITPPEEVAVNAHREIRNRVRKYYNNKIIATVKGNSTFAKKFRTKDHVDVKFDVTRVHANPTLKSTDLVIWIMPVNQRAGVYNYENLNLILKINSGDFQISQLDATTKFIDTVWDKYPEIQFMPGVFDVNGGLTYRDHVGSGIEAIDSSKFVDHYGFHIKLSAPIPSPDIVVQDAIIHEFYHVFFDVDVKSDEYHTDSPYFKDYKSIGHVGMELRERHLENLLNDVNLVDKDTQFRLYLKN